MGYVPDKDINSFVLMQKSLPMSKSMSLCTNFGQETLPYLRLPKWYASDKALATVSDEVLFVAPFGTLA